LSGNDITNAKYFILGKGKEKKAFLSNNKPDYPMFETVGLE
jgi:hypothetical protein